MKETNTWCPLPWVFQALRNNGDIRVCCQANVSESRGIMRKLDGSAFNAKSDSLDLARNAPLIKEIRRAMLDNKEHSACVRCKNEDLSGIRSRRTYERENWAQYFTEEDARAATDSDGTINTSKVKAVYYDIRLGNHCNLKCRMCGPTDSSAWYSDQVQVWGTNYQDSHGNVQLIKNDSGAWSPENNDYGWIDSDNFWKQIENNISQIKHIHTVGGEPLLIPQHFNLLEKCVEAGVAHNIAIEYNSNVTTIPERAWALWEKFRMVNIGVSLDGFGSVNEYIRHPSRWGKIEANIDRLDQAPGNFRIWLATTVQAYNILHLPEFLKWRLQKNFQRVNSFHTQPLITTHPLHNPHHLNVKILPHDYKLLVANRFDDFYGWLEDWLRSRSLSDYDKDNYRFHARKLLDGYKDFMFADDWSVHLEKFWAYTKKLDLIRNQDIADVLPELHTSVTRYLREKPNRSINQAAGSHSHHR